ncbi:MAG TPA: GNAT family N-acetyltransferase [Rhizomicrobium sp.]
MSCKLETERLLLRYPEAGDVTTIASLIGDFEVSKNLGTVPHPYAEEDAMTWFSSLADRRARGEAYQFGVTRKSDGAYMGGCGLHLKDGEFELGYWFGKPYWRQGYATEAARRLVVFAFDDLKAAGVWAGWFHDNPRSGHVLAKLGFRPKGFEKRACMARGEDVGCNIVTLDRAAFGERRAA